MSNRKYIGDEVTENGKEKKYDIPKKKGADRMNRMNQTLFQQYAMEGTEPVLVAFCASWCGYCRRITPALKRLAEQNRGKFWVGIMDIDMEPELARQEEIEVLPTLVLYQQGRVLGSIVGPDSQSIIEEFMEETLTE